MDTYIADVLADKLLASGAREEARAVALTIREGGRPVHRVEAELLLLRIQASEASFEAALAAARPALEIAADDVGWVRVQKLEIAWRALQIAEIVGRAAEVADLVVERFLDPEPPPLDGVHLLAPMRIPAICALASARTSRRCFSRFDALRGRLSGGVLPATETFVRGARLYATGDLRGAALAWKSLVGKAGLLAQAMTDQMMAALAESGDSELASQLEAAARARAGDFNGASLSDVRAARAAAAAKDWPTARALAEKVIRAWSASDGAVPAVEQMRKLLTTLK